MKDEYKRGLEKNVGKYSWFKIFSKRVYLPLIVVYLADNGVSAKQLGLIALITAVTQILLQIPTGYLADKLGVRKVIVFGTLVAAISPFFYVVFPGFWGGLLGVALFWCGYSFQSGALEAFMHDTLVELGKERSYTKVMGRAQSYGLMGNVVLLSLVPLTYTIDKRIPFVIGIVSHLINFWLALNFTYPKRQIELDKPNPLEALRKVATPRNISLFILSGALLAIMYRGQEFRELAFQEVGISAGYFGIIVAASSLLAALMGRSLHHVDRIKANTFYLLNVVGLSGAFVGIGLTRNPWVIIVGFVLLLAYSRVQTIIITAKLLESANHAYKSTLVSSLQFVESLEELWVIPLLTTFVTTSGYVRGNFGFGLSIGAIGLVLLAAHLLVHRKYRPAV